MGTHDPSNQIHFEKNTLMKKSVFLIIVWLIFVMWEIEVAKWIQEEAQHVFRIDLVIILPGLVLLTLYTLKNNFNNIK